MSSNSTLAISLLLLGTVQRFTFQSSHINVLILIWDFHTFQAFCSSGGLLWRVCKLCFLSSFLPYIFSLYFTFTLQPILPCSGPCTIDPYGPKQWFPYVLTAGWVVLIEGIGREVEEKCALPQLPPAKMPWVCSTPLPFSQLLLSGQLFTALLCGFW